MSEKVYKYTTSDDEKVVERIIDDRNIHLNHMMLVQGTGLPVHNSNSNVYMIITRGIMTIDLNDRGQQSYAMGNIINIPYNTKMDVTNKHEEALEFFVVKSPNPRDYRRA